MRNVYEGGTESLVDLCKLGSHCRTELGIKVGKRLVKKEDLRLTDNGTAECNTLFLTAGKSLRTSVKKVGYVKDAGCFLDLALDFLL